MRKGTFLLLVSFIKTYKTLTVAILNPISSLGMLIHLGMADNIALTKSYDLSIKVCTYVFMLQKAKKEFDITRQLIRSITSIGANITEAQGSQSKRDFLHKISIAYKEALESEYWLHILIDLNFIDKDMGTEFTTECMELVKILGATKARLTKNLKQ